jgi:hypothetical protein
MLLSSEGAAYTKKEYRLASMRGYASCWHMSDEDPQDEMWQRKFGNNHKGIALRTTPEALRVQLGEIVSATGPGYIGEVEYIDHKEDLVPEGNTLEVAFRVREEFSYQREARVYVHCYGAPAATVLAAEHSMWDTRLVRRVPPRQSFSRKREFVGFVPPKASEEARKHNWKAMVPRIAPEQLIDEILVGWRVSDAEYTDLLKMVSESPLRNNIRRTVRRPNERSSTPEPEKVKSSR